MCGEVMLMLMLSAGGCIRVLTSQHGPQPLCEVRVLFDCSQQRSERVVVSATD